MLTKEEILEANYSNYKKRIAYEDNVFKAMDIFAREVAVDFFDWQKKDQAECSADMSTEDYFDKYLKQKQ